MTRLTSLVAVTVGILSTLATVSANYVPKFYNIGANVTNAGLQPYTKSLITLDVNSPIVTLDYGHEIAGWPYVEVEALAEPVQIELKYSEPFDGLKEAQGDGPWYEFCQQ